MDPSRDMALLGLQLLLPLAASLAIARALLPPLSPLLDELCGGAVRARFWVVFTALVLFIGPVLIVMLADLPGCDFGTWLRALLVRSLSGALLTLLAVAFVIWRTIRHTEPVS